MARRGKLRRLAGAVIPRGLHLGGAGRRDAHRLAGIDEAGATPEIAGIEQAAYRYGEEVAVGHVEVAVGIGEPRRLRVEMDALDADRLRLCHIEALEHAEYLEESQAARARRSHAADDIDPVRPADRRPLLRLVGGEVGQGDVARIYWCPGHSRDDVRRDPAGIEGGRTTLRHGAEPPRPPLHAP